MAYFKKYNGYIVKDAEAIKHVHLNGNRMTTTDADGNTVDTFLLPGGDFSSPIYKKYDPLNLTGALATVVDEYDMSNEVRSLDFWGYTTSTVVDWDPDHPAIQMGDTIYADTLHAWQNFAATSNEYMELSYQNAYMRQIRPNTYKTVATFARADGFSVAAGTRYEVVMLPTDGYMSVKAPDGQAIGYAIPVSAEIVGNKYASSAIVHILDGSVYVTNPFENSIFIQRVKVYFDVILFDEFTTKFLQNENVNTPFIEGVYTSILADTAANTRTVETRVIVKNRSTSSAYSLDEYELQQVDGAWSWVKTSTQAIPTTSMMTHYNETFTFQHSLGARTGDTQKTWSGAVWYRVSLDDISHDTSDVVILPRRRAVS